MRASKRWNKRCTSCAPSSRGKFGPHGDCSLSTTTIRIEDNLKARRTQIVQVTQLGTPRMTHSPLIGRHVKDGKR